MQEKVKRLSVPRLRETEKKNLRELLGKKAAETFLSKRVTRSEEMIPVLAEAVHCVVVVLRLDKYLLSTRTVTMTLQPATLYAVGFIVLIWNEYLAKPM